MNFEELKETIARITVDRDGLILDLESVQEREKEIRSAIRAADVELNKARNDLLWLVKYPGQVPWHY